eukprot:6179044-Pleurochrysis_carterae.AAC.1
MKKQKEYAVQMHSPRSMDMQMAVEECSRMPSLLRGWDRASLLMVAAAATSSAVDRQALNFEESRGTAACWRVACVMQQCDNRSYARGAVAEICGGVAWMTY